ncbi:hypothetical protein [Cochlodiniinecator piscidefendens]|uniref:hypothetical protein n=1 Tax=Cochlodiniinecator piscidefendens TaxID=2715756 RepID=UPI00140A7D94|nr:hypothetical protein [Cochlodiniinecator piscidefendens]
MQKPEDFTKFYFTKVGMGEACGCAERVIDVYEFNRKGGAAEQVQISKPSRPFSLRRAWKKLGRAFR